MLRKNVDMRVGIKTIADQVIIKNRRLAVEVAVAMIGNVRTSTSKKIFKKTKKKRNRLNHVATRQKLRRPPRIYNRVDLAG